MWIFFGGLFYIVVVMVYSNYNIAKKKDKTPMFAVFKGNIRDLSRDDCIKEFIKRK